MSERPLVRSPTSESGQNAHRNGQNAHQIRKTFKFRNGQSAHWSEHPLVKMATTFTKMVRTPKCIIGQNAHWSDRPLVKMVRTPTGQIAHFWKWSERPQKRSERPL